MLKKLITAIILPVSLFAGTVPASAAEVEVPSGSLLLLSTSTTPSKVVGLNKFYPIVGEIVGAHLANATSLHLFTEGVETKVTTRTQKGFAVSTQLTLKERILVTAGDSADAQTRSVFLPVLPMSPFNSGSVQFKLDSALLSPEAREILRKVADEAISVGLKGIYAAGHADTSGTNKYNLALSSKRAQATVDYLKKYLSIKGVTDVEVGIENMGLYVPLKTRDESRRVEILLYPAPKQ